MSQASPRKKTKNNSRSPTLIHSHWREAGVFSLALAAVFMWLALLSYSHEDASFTYQSSSNATANWVGPFGAWFADIAHFLMGYSAWFIPLAASFLTWALLQLRDELLTPSFWLTKTSGVMLAIIGGAGLATRYFSDPSDQPSYLSGGVIGELFEHSLTANFSPSGSSLFLIVLFLIGVTLFTGLSWFRVMDKLGAWTLHATQWSVATLMSKREQWQNDRAIASAREEREQIVQVERERLKERKAPKIEPVAAPIEISPRVRKEKEQAKQKTLFDDTVVGDLPAMDLLEEASASKRQVSAAALEAVSRQVELKLRDFGIDAAVVAVHPGPVITRFELDPAPGIKVSRITNLSKDLARALSVTSVRVVEVIPGKSTVGLEVPNETRETVRLREVLSSKEFDDVKSPLAMALGKDIAGKPVVVDLARMPHLLVAGTTGSGKSVGLNAMLLSMLYKADPSELRMIMIDPKMLELSVYADIPHLLTPVVTDMKDAANALRWSVVEMDRRYKLMSALGVRNLAGYNKKVEDAQKAGEPIPDPLWKAETEYSAHAPALSKLPVIVIVIDELADMMMIVGKKVEELIARIAQKARAAGIHLILATQRPSVDVITGLIKANVPTRIAFQVSSRIDSRTILDQQGAEALLGQGDMLYLPPGTSVPTRVHGAYVADDEVHRVVQDWRKRGQPSYLEITSGSSDGDNSGGGFDLGDGDGGGEKDEFYDQAVHFVTETRRVSVSSLQRKFKIGFTRAARWVEEMEAAGIVSAMGHNGNREVIAPPPP